MAIIIRRAKPITIKRRAKLPEPRAGVWPGKPGYPPAADRKGYHAIRIKGETFVFLWNPDASLGVTWTCGMWGCSPSILRDHDYMGEVSIVYRASSCVPSDFYIPTKRRFR